VRAVSLEHKLGIHGSPTCVMAFEGARAELIGQANQGLAHMFVMMNAARLHVGMQGVAIAERAFQQALAYAQDRRQGRGRWQPSDTIFGHPDVRNTLVLMKAKIEAARGICLSTAVQADLARLAPEHTQRVAAQALCELLTPIAKAWSTDIGVEVVSDGLQIHGGMGYIEETGAAQHYRDARILPIYEGSNGIQAIDLVGRKVAADDGRAMAGLCAAIREVALKAQATPSLAVAGQALGDAVSALEQASAWILANNGEAALSAATPYLRLAGDVVGGWVLLRNALTLMGAEDPRLPVKALLAELYAHRVLRLAPGRATGLMGNPPTMAELSADALAG
jgi:hypothetical protein